MTTAKADQGKSEKRLHHGGTSNIKGRKASLTSEEITGWFRVWGIVGRRRQDDKLKQYLYNW